MSEENKIVEESKGTKVLKALAELKAEDRIHIATTLKTPKALQTLNSGHLFKGVMVDEDGSKALKAQGVKTVKMPRASNYKVNTASLEGVIGNHQDMMKALNGVPVVPAKNRSR